MLRKQLLLAAVSVLLSGLVSAQRTWIVDADNRPGTDFTDIPPAVAAAVAGDIIRVRIPTSGAFYHAPNSQLSGPPLTKPLQIIGDNVSGVPLVSDPWVVAGLPPDSVLSLSNLRMRTAVFFATSCQGAIVLNNVSNAGMAGGELVGGYGVPAFWLTDCSMVVFSHCNFHIQWDLRAVRSRVMIDDSSIRSEHYPQGSPRWGEGGVSALSASEADVVISRSTLAGASANRDTDASGTPYYLNAHPAIRMCKSNIQIGKGCTLEAGSYYYGGSNYISEIDCYLSNPPPTPPIVCTMAIDPGTVLIGPLLPPGQVVYDFTPQTGLSYQVSPTTLTVTHYANPQSLCILAIGTLTTTPWTNIVGPVFIDPIGASQFWDPAPTTGTVVRTFPIPPGLPRGYQATLQAFELQQSGAIRTSNAGIVAVP